MHHLSCPPTQQPPQQPNADTAGSHAHTVVILTVEVVLCACVSGKQVIGPEDHVFQKTHISLMSVSCQGPVGMGVCPWHAQRCPV